VTQQIRENATDLGTMITGQNLSKLIKNQYETYLSWKVQNQTQGSQNLVRGPRLLVFPFIISSAVLLAKV